MMIRWEHSEKGDSHDYVTASPCKYAACVEAGHNDHQVWRGTKIWKNQQK